MYTHLCHTWYRPEYATPRIDHTTDDDMDILWRHAYVGEKAVPLKQIPAWLNMEEDNLVKPTGPLRDSLMIISSYPTTDGNSTVHHR